SPPGWGVSGYSPPAPTVNDWTPETNNDGTNKTPPAPPLPARVDCVEWGPDAPPPAINHASNNSPPSKSCSPDSVNTSSSPGPPRAAGRRSASHGTNTARFTVTSSPQSTHSW